MRTKGLVIAALSLAGCDAIYTPPDIFDLPRGDAYSKVALADFSMSRTFMRDASVSRKPGSSIAWSYEGQQCTAKFLPFEESKTQVDVSCAGGVASNSAIAGMTLALMRKEVIERVDSAIEGREFDPRRAKGATAAGWPGDKVDHGGGIFEAKSNAFAMEAEAKREQAEWERNNP